MEIKTRMQAGRWTLAYFDAAAADGRRFLTEEQYWYVVGQLEQLGDEDDPTHPLTVDVRPIEDYHELRDKGGILGKINLRVYFWVATEHRTIVVLGSVKKEAEGKVPSHVKIRMRNRKREAERILAKESDSDNGQ